jgi:hypothetical protein
MSGNGGGGFLSTTWVASQSDHQPGMSAWVQFHKVLENIRNITQGGGLQ